MDSRGSGEWVAEGSQTESHHAQAAFSKEAPSLSLPRLETVSRSDVRLTQATCLSTALCAGVLSVKILIERSREEGSEKTQKNGYQTGNTSMINPTSDNILGLVTNFSNSFSLR